MSLGVLFNAEEVRRIVTLILNEHQDSAYRKELELSVEKIHALAKTKDASYSHILKSDFFELLMDLSRTPGNSFTTVDDGETFVLSSYADALRARLKETKQRPNKSTQSDSSKIKEENLRQFVVSSIEIWLREHSKSHPHSEQYFEDFKLYALFILLKVEIEASCL